MSQSTILYPTIFATSLTCVCEYSDSVIEQLSKFVFLMPKHRNSKQSRQLRNRERAAQHAISKSSNRHVVVATDHPPHRQVVFTPNSPPQRQVVLIPEQPQRQVVHIPEKPQQQVAIVSDQAHRKESPHTFSSSPKKQNSSSPLVPVCETSEHTGEFILELHSNEFDIASV